MLQAHENPHALMKRATERKLKIEEAQQAILKSVDESIAHYEATGLHITLDEVKAWAKAVEEDPNAELPACHT